MAALALIAFWLACGALAFGMFFAMWQRRFVLLAGAHLQMESDIGTSAAMGFLLGPLALPVLLIFWRPRYGLKYAPRIDPDWEDQVYRYWLAKESDPERARRLSDIIIRKATASTEPTQ